MSQEAAPQLPDEPDRLEVAVDEAIAACDGNMRSAIKALIVANEYLEGEVKELMQADRVTRLLAGTVQDLQRLISVWISSESAAISVR